MGENQQTGNRKYFIHLLHDNSLGCFVLPVTVSKKKIILTRSSLTNIEDSKNNQAKSGRVVVSGREK